MKVFPLCAVLLMCWLTGGPSLFAEPVKKLLFVGDSITAHGIKPDLGWTGRRGMASSDLSKDYVHLFTQKLTEAQSGAPEIHIAGGGGGKITDRLKVKEDIAKFGADLAIIQLGENDNENVNQVGFQKPYEEVLEAVRKGNKNVRIFCMGVWCPPMGNPKKDELIRAACAKFGATFVDLAAVNADPMNKADAEGRYTHPGVVWHPGDKGMGGYANAIWSAFSASINAPR